MRKSFPNWKECVCIFIHDWGYWGCENMEGVEGQRHPEYGAQLAHKLLDVGGDNTYKNWCLYHSRSYASKNGAVPSELCWFDKLCVIYDPWWLYLPRVMLSGELHEYRAEAINAGLIDPKISNREWYEWARARMIRKAYAQDARPPYTRGS